MTGTTETSDVARAVVLHSAGDVRVEDRPLAALAPDQLLIAVSLGGICGSDISYYKHGAVGAYQVRQPMVLGHEVVGCVFDAGANSSFAADGARVAVDPSTPCGRCPRCLEDRQNLCLQPTFLGSASTDPHTDGGFATFLPTPATNVVPLDDALSDDRAVFAEPLAVTVHAVRRSGGVADANVLIVGAGPIGAMLAALCRHYGAADIVVADVNEQRLELVTRMGIESTTLVGQQDPGRDYDIVFDASGSGAAIADALTRVRRGGRLVLVGLPHGGPIDMQLTSAITGEVDLVGSFRFNHDEFRESVGLLHAGLDLDLLISGRHHIHDASAAFAKAASGQAMKVQLDFTGTTGAP